MSSGDYDASEGSVRYERELQAHRDRIAARPSFETIMMELATSLSKRSTCRRLSVGCVIVSPDFRTMYAGGYNGNAAGLPNDCDSATPGACGCFPSGTLVSATGIQRAYRRRYVGDLIRIITADGDLTATPNHPILALGRGFVPAESLREGDHMLKPVGDEHMLPGAPHDQHRVQIEDAFEALSKAAPSRIRRAGGRHQFHGDGSTDEHVDVVTIDFGLRDDLEAGLAKRLRELTFAAADQEAAAFGGGGSRLTPPQCAGIEQPAVYDNRRDAHRSRDPFRALAVGVSREDLVDGEVDHRLALVASEILSHLAQDPSLAQTVLNARVRDAERRSDVDNLLAGKVTANKIVRVERYAWTGHVFNLQTASGWYCAGNEGMIVQNCLHAEENAIISCTIPRAASKVAVVTHSPCVMCAKRLIQLGGVERVIYGIEYRDTTSLRLLERVGITVQQLV